MRALHGKKQTLGQSDSIGALTDMKFWDSVWQQNCDLVRLDFSAPGKRALADFLKRVLPCGEKNIIEIGCGSSAWLPFFAKQWGYSVYGIDFSPVGVDTARRNLEVHHVEGQIVEGDLFDHDSLPEAYFDIVFSNGFIEHFSDTLTVISRMKSLLKPGGLMVTVVPNLQGIHGFIQKRINRSVYNQHVILSGSSLERIHRMAELETIGKAEYLGGFDLWALNWGVFFSRWGVTFHRLFGKLVSTLHLAARLGLRLCGIRDGWWISSMIVIVSQKGSPPLEET